jgi:hypothetical protein
MRSLPALSQRSPSTAPRVSCSTPTYYFLAIITNVESTMSSTLGQNPSSNFKSILDAGLNRALSEYEKKTGKPLFDNELATKLQQCDSADAIKAIFEGQAEAFEKFRDGDKRLMEWINPVVDVLSAFSDTIGATAGIVRPKYSDRDNLKCILSLNFQAFPPAGAIFTGIGVLLDVRVFAVAIRCGPSYLHIL